jgi:hypothetical protein
MFSLKSCLIPKKPRVLLRSQVWKELLKGQLRGIFWIRCTNENYRSFIFDSIYTLRFTNVVMNILLYNLNLKIQEIPSKFDYKQNINLFGIRFVGVGLKYNTLDVLIFSIFFVCINL